MIVHQGFEDLNLSGGSVASLGNYDGVHLGHRRVLETALSTAPELAPTVVTFWPHPRIVLGNEVGLLTTLDRRLELLAEAGVGETLVVEFTVELATSAPPFRGYLKTRSSPLPLRNGVPAEVVT